MVWQSAVSQLAPRRGIPLPEKKTPGTIGDLAPDFELADTSGDSFSLAGLRGQKAVVLVFTRGFG